MSKIPEVLNNYPKLPANFTEVSQGKWKSVEGIDGNAPLGSLAVSSCAVVAVRNIETARAYFGHFSQPHSKNQGDQKAFDAMIEAIIDERTDPAHTFEAWASGTSLFGDSGEETEIHDAEALVSRDYILKGLAKLGPGTSVITNWLGEKEHIPIVALDPTGDPVLQWTKGPRTAGETEGEESPLLVRSLKDLSLLLPEQG